MTPSPLNASSPPADPSPRQSGDQPWFSLPVVALGATSIVTQIVLVREFLSVFFGNELVIGIILANWMVLTGAGAFLGRRTERMKRKRAFLVVSLALLGILPAATLFLLDGLRNVVFPVGVMIGLWPIIYCSLVLLAPYCLLSGFLFTYFAGRVSEARGSDSVPRVYGLESAGSLLGGGAFTLLAVYFLSSFQSLVILMGVNFTLSVVYLRKSGVKVLSYAAAGLGALLLLAVLFLRPESLAKKLLFPDQEVLLSRDTPYGSLVVARQGDQVNFFENSILLFSTNDVTQNEEAVHYAMLQHPEPRNVLLIGGGISGTISEILKYNPERVDYVEINPWIIEMGRKLTGALSSGRVNVINEDARLYVRNAPRPYDAVLINLPDPTTAQINRYYTAEFFSQLKNAMAPGAVVSMGVLSSVDYLSQEARRINSTMERTLKGSFRNVLFVPGMRNYVLASDGVLSVEIGRLVQERKVSNLYVNQYYLDDQILRERSGYIQKNLDTTAAPNRDFMPVAYYEQLVYWLNYFGVNPAWIAAACVLLLLVVVVRLDAVSFGILAAGFAGSSVEVILLIAFQIIYGYVYQMTGVIITVFMGGLAVGAMFRRRAAPVQGMNTFITVQVLICAEAMLLPLVFLFLQAHSVNSIVVHAFILVLTLVIAFLVGMLFRVAAGLSSGRASAVASGLYSVDLLGSAGGALLVSAYLIPLLGISSVSLTVAALVAVSVIVSFLQRKKFVLHGGVRDA